MKKFQPFLLIIFCMVRCASAEDEHFVNTFAVSLRDDVQNADDVVQDIASSLGFTVEHKLESINVYLLSHPSVQHRSKRSAEHHVNSLESHPQILHAQQEIELIRKKREIIHDKQLELPIREIDDPSVYHRVAAPRLALKDDIPRPVVHFKDPFFKDQWYINNVGQSGGKVGLDLNVMIAWQNNINGSGIVVCILDDGIDHKHHDLVENYDPKASTDLNDLSDKKKDPMPNKLDPSNSHGTRCAGEIASKAGNNVCGVGVAYGARIGGVRLLDGLVTDSLEAAALNFNLEYIDIYSASWGPTDDGRTMDAPKHYASLALEHGITHGRHGRGTLFAWATGNGGNNGDDCGADGYVSSVFTMSFGSSTDRGRRPYFTENCTSTLAVVPSGGEEWMGEEKLRSEIKLKVVTTDVDNKCIENFQGTSSAAPLAAGCLALVLQANGDLTWRDVQHIVVRGSRLPSVDASWTINGANLHVSHSFGFGVMDCGEMVRLALDWQMVPAQHVCEYDRHGLYKEIPSQGHTEDHIFVYDGCVNDDQTRIERLEHVQVSISVEHHRRGDIQISLISPSGTRSELLSPRSNDDSSESIHFTFMTVHSWMERPHGVWTLEVHNKPGSSGRRMTASLVQWSLRLYGTEGYQFTDVTARHALTQASAESLAQQLTDVMVQEEKRSRSVTLRFTAQFSQRESERRDRDRGLKNYDSDFGNDDKELNGLGNNGRYDLRNVGKVLDGVSDGHGKLKQLLDDRQSDRQSEGDERPDTRHNVGDESSSKLNLDAIQDDQLIDALLRVLDDDINVDDIRIQKVKSHLRKRIHYSGKSTHNANPHMEHTGSVKKSLTELLELLKAELK